jgi:3-dehydroquinate synthase
MSNKRLTAQKTKLHFVSAFPKPNRFGSETLLIFDRKLPRYVPGFSNWAKGFAANYAVTAGEKLKDVDCFPQHAKNILKRTKDLSARDLTIVVAGGGSVGDFGGFIASVLKRGVRLVHIPTTWLSALDSSHGGKTALNAGDSKNQFGTFYPASDVYLIKSVLQSQPEIRARDAAAELVKIALIENGAWVKRLEAGKVADVNDLMWKHLKPAIEAKLKIVKRDPFEKHGLRQVLNFGHTFGHVLEAELKLSHGQAVAQGLFFALAWSFRRGDLSIQEYGRARHLLESKFGFRALSIKSKPQLTGGRTRARLLQDKKREAKQRLTFVFLEKFGRPIRDLVTVDEVIAEVDEQGWLK